MRAVLCSFIAVALSACAGTDAHVRTLESYGDLRIDHVTAPTHDYEVRVRNGVEINYDPENPETRRATVLRAMKYQCPNARIVGERIFELGENLFRKNRDYIVQVKCA